MHNPLIPFDEIHNIFLSNPFLLNFSKASSSISLSFTEKYHEERRIFASENPEKFLNTEQEVECEIQIFTSYKLSLKQQPIPMSQMSAVLTINFVQLCN